MDDQGRKLAIIMAILVVVVGFFALRPVVREALAPQPQEAFVAIQAQGEEVAFVGPVELAAGTPFTLHAVLRGERRDGSPVYYTEAKRLSLAGREVAPETLEPWPSSRFAKVRWYTVEASRPALHLSAASGVSPFRMDDMLRADWPLTWQIPGTLRSALAEDGDPAAKAVHGTSEFGLQRFHVRIELYREERDLLPEQIFRSWGAKELKSQLDQFPTVTARLPAPLATVSGHFGLIYLDAPPELPPAALAQVAELTASRVAFSQVSLLSAHVAAQGLSWQDLVWRDVALNGSTPWEDGSGGAAGAGALLRVGDRIAILAADANQNRQLDVEDLCFDFQQGLKTLRVGEVFAEMAELAPLVAPAANVAVSKTSPTTSTP